jgi:glycosyltransferase involved in cell wall biosynthesis
VNFLFAHQNFPGQYLHLARHLAAAGHQVVFLTQRHEGELPGVRKVVYKPTRPVTPTMHQYLMETEAGILNAQQVARVALTLRQQGFVPDVMLGHNAWGEIWYLRDIFPTAPLIGYFEFYYRTDGADYAFDPADLKKIDDGPRIRTRNLGNLLGLESSTLGQTPTQWQCSRYPERYQSMLRIAHEGIDTRSLVPDPNAQLALPGGRVLTAADEVVTYVARNLEPYRGFPTFMRSLPAVLQRRPTAQVVIVGGDQTSYGAAPEDGVSYREKLLRELEGSLDLSRVHFLGLVPRPTFVKILQVSRAHVYLTYPFILGWSMLEAMSAGRLVIGSRTAPVEEVIRDGENGLLVDFFSPEALSEAIVRALAADDACGRMRANARQTIVEGYDLHDVCIPRQMQLIEETLNRRLYSP